MARKCKQFISTDENPAQFINKDHAHNDPNHHELLQLKAQQQFSLNLRSWSLHVADLNMKESFDLAALSTQFDVIVIDAPWVESCQENMHDSWSLEELKKLNIPQIAAEPCVIFIWCGSGGSIGQNQPHVDDAYELMDYWGFRLCEDITWIKTGNPNTTNEGGNPYFNRVKEHCLMGMKGNVWKSTSSKFVHPNVDCDVIVAGTDPLNQKKKPTAFYQLVERFCQGLRRLELFGSDDSIRPGWLTIGPSVTSSNFTAKEFDAQFLTTHPASLKRNGAYSAPFNEEIENLRPKSPKRNRETKKKKSKSAKC